MALGWNGREWVKVVAKKPIVDGADQIAAAAIREQVREARKRREAAELQERADRLMEAQRQAAVVNRRDPQFEDVEEFLEFDDFDDPPIQPVKPAAKPLKFNPAPWHGVVNARDAQVIVDRAVNPFDLPAGFQPAQYVWGREGRIKAEGGNPVEEVMDKPMPYERTERTTRMPRFKVKYATGDEFKLRLENTIVTINDNLVFVQRVHSIGDQWGCEALSSDGKRSIMLFEENGLNLRSPDPGYIQIDNTTYHMVRKPARVYKQGLMSDNTVFRSIHNDAQAGLFNNLPLHMILKALNERPVLEWEPKMLEGKKSVRLSDRIAVIGPTNKYKHPRVEHLGFVIGTLHGSTVLSDHVTMWSERACGQVGLNLKPKNKVENEL